MDAYEVLVIILSVFLTVFILLGIILLIMFIQILKRAKKVTASLEGVVNNVEVFSYKMSKTAAPLAFLKIVTDMFRRNKTSR